MDSRPAARRAGRQAAAATATARSTRTIASVSLILCVDTTSRVRIPGWRRMPSRIQGHTGQDSPASAQPDTPQNPVT